jgi:hypothetical protein
VRLVVGVIRLVEDIANLARAGKPGQPTTLAGLAPAATAAPAPKAQTLDLAYREMDRMEKLADAKPREIVKEGVSEYFMYTVEGRDTILTGWSKRLPSFKADGVPITSYYKYEKERFNENVMRFYQFTNSVPSKLGKEPLPDGAVKAFRFVTDDWLYAFVGSTSVKYIPIDEYVELGLGNDQEVLVKPKLMDWQKTDIKFDQRGNVSGWTIKETWQIEVQNSKEIPVTLDIRRNFSGDWTLSTTAKYENVDATKVKFVLPLKPREKQTFTYELTTRHGTSKTR